MPNVSRARSVEVEVEGAALDRPELRALLATCAREGTPTARRDACGLALLYGAGLRRTEAVSLDLADYNPRDGALTVRRGKGRMDRIVRLSIRSRHALRAWLAVRGDQPGPLLTPAQGGRQVQLRRMSEVALYRSLNRRAGAVGLYHTRLRAMYQTDRFELFLPRRRA